MPSGSHPDRPDRIGDCYRIEGELGHGGMARVYRVVDERSGARLALKRLVGESERQATLQAMFEREYHTLAQLVHPRIVRVFDYGLDGEDPYYTMELLEGSDVRRALRTQALEVRDICSVLRDAASALALIHSRRLVHRDVSPRNLWFTPDRRAKLIDFGTLVAMGPQSRAAGTAPYVPPEAVYMQPLDARCDLYALGALGYILLTQHNAYPARDIGELRQIWKRRPQRPDAVRPEIPRQLADLVMALLSLDPRGRPGSASEVVERLSAIADLPQEDERHLAQSFLTSPTLVGRAEGTTLLRKRLQRARRGRCNSLAIVAPAGFGRSRMLESCVLEAKLMGATAISVDAGAAGPAPLALAGILAERLLEAVPRAALDAIELAGLLGHVSPALHRAFGEPELVALTARDSASKLSTAFVRLFEAASRHHHLLVAVDDVQRADGASLVVLARLGALGGARLLLVTSCDEAALGKHSPLLDQLVKERDRLVLAPLAAEDTRALLRSLFDDVPELDAAASWLHELSQGSPQTCMQYAQYLVDHGLARYEGGRWRLPERLREQTLPSTLGAMLEGRVQQLSDDARALALGLALSRDESRALWQPEKHLQVEDLPTLLDDAITARDARGTSHAARAYVALDELLRAGVVQQRDNCYALGQRAIADLLLRVSGEDAQRAMHRRIARTFKRGAVVDMSMVRHLQRAGEHLRARELLQSSAEYFGGSGVVDWGAVRVSVTAECARIAYEHWQAHGGSPREGVLLRRMLLLTCSVYDWSNTRFADAQFAQLRADCGLVHWEGTDASRPQIERVVECLQRAQETYDRTPEPERGLAPGDAVREIAACALSIFGAFASRFEGAQARRLHAWLEPLRPLSPAIALIADLTALGIDRAVGGELGQRLLECALRAEQTPGLTDLLRQSVAVLSRYSQAIADMRQGSARSLDVVEQLLRFVDEDMFLVSHARWLAHAFRGRADLAARYRRQAELASEDDVWRRRACLFIEAELYALAGDLVNLERTSEAIAALADLFPGWIPWRSFARAEIHRLRGELPAAQAELEAALALAQPGEHRAWIGVAPALAEVLLLRGDAAGALRMASSIVADVEARSLNGNAAVAAERVRALAESNRGEHAAALAAIEHAFERGRVLGFDGLPLAQLHEAHARILLAAGQAEACAGALSALHDLIAHADAPALIRGYEALRAENPQAATPELSSTPITQSGAESSQLWTEVSTRLGAENERAARARQALALLLEDSACNAGHLFLFHRDRLFLAASSGASGGGEALLRIAQRLLDVELSRTSSDAAVTTTATSNSRSNRPRAAATEQFTPLLLPSSEVSGESGEPVVIGLVLLTGHGASQRIPRPALLRAVGRCLHLAGDGDRWPPASVRPDPV